jgi:hypothetical protein
MALMNFYEMFYVICFTYKLMKWLFTLFVSPTNLWKEVSNGHDKLIQNVYVICFTYKLIKGSVEWP